MNNSTKFNRRHFLRGASGVAVAIPFLSSLEKSSRAQADTGPRRLINFITHHGGAWSRNMHPVPETLTESLAYAGFDIRRGDLGLQAADGRAQLSPIISASSGAFTANIASKMNVVRGLGSSWSWGHQQAVHMGNPAATTGAANAGTDEGHMAQYPMPTIDNILAYSSKFYPSSPYCRVATYGQGDASWNYENPQDRTSRLVPADDIVSPRRLFDRIYVAPAAGGGEAMPQTAIVDFVLEDYRRLREGGRLSALDRSRLDAHMSHLSELERRLTQTVGCEETPAPDGGVDSGTFYSGTQSRENTARYYQLVCDVVALGLACDTTRLVTINTNEGLFSDYPAGGDWHEEVAHQAQTTNDVGSVAQQRQADHYQGFFEDTFLYLVNKLEEVSEGEGTLLDSSLVTWLQESGMITHHAQDLTVVTAGSAGGNITTGSYVDYRNQNLTLLDHPQHRIEGDGINEVERPGLLWGQYLGTVLQAMGLDPEDYEQGPYGGYGVTYLSTVDLGEEFTIDYDGCYPEAVRQAQHESLPFLVS